MSLASQGRDEVLHAVEIGSMAVNVRYGRFGRRNSRKAVRTVRRSMADQVANGEVSMLWLGAALSPQILDDLFGVDALEDVDIRLVRPCSFSG